VIYLDQQTVVLRADDVRRVMQQLDLAARH
jgi:hypothetical protein